MSNHFRALYVKNLKVVLQNKGYTSLKNNMAVASYRKVQSGQKVAYKFTKLSEIGFCMECFGADFSRVFNENVKIWLLGVRLGTRNQIQAFQGFS